MEHEQFESTLVVDGKKYKYFSLEKIANFAGIDIKKIPYSLKILIENVARSYKPEDLMEGLKGFQDWVDNGGKTDREIFFKPSRILMQDFTGVPAIVDLAAMLDQAIKIKKDPAKIDPIIPVDLVIDHSFEVEYYKFAGAKEKNLAREMERNIERYEFLKWGQKTFPNLQVIPPGVGICHQVNLEFLAKVVAQNGDLVYPDTVFGTDSHTTMINGIGVLGWGVGGIEAEAAMLNQPSQMIIPQVVGVCLKGKLGAGITATDLVLTITELLRSKDVVGKFVEFYGPGLESLSLADRATIANMAPEYGATCGFFPVDSETIKYLKLTNRNSSHIKLVMEYFIKQDMWSSSNHEPLYTENIEFDLSRVGISISGPKRPQDRVDIHLSKKSFEDAFGENHDRVVVPNYDWELRHGDIVIAAITSCTNTSNPSVMIGAGLLAKKAVNFGIKPRPWIKTSIAPGSPVVEEYLSASGLLYFLEKLGFYIVGHGCSTCIGNSGPLLPEIEQTITTNKLSVASVLSGNRNFEGRIHPLVRANYLASPPLVVLYSLFGNIKKNISIDTLEGHDGKHYTMNDLWPDREEISAYVNDVVSPVMFKEKYANILDGPKEWQDIKTVDSQTYSWSKSTYINNPPYFTENNQSRLRDIHNARILCLFGDFITTDHISPAGNIAKNSPAAAYLLGEGVSYEDFNSYGARRGNHEVMMRGTFANTRIKNEICDGVEGGVTKIFPQGTVTNIYEAAMHYKNNNVPAIVIAGKEYGSGSSRDWAAKGPMLLGVVAVIAESFERIHRSNLVGMGVIPLKFPTGQNRHTLGLKGHETISIIGIEQILEPMQNVKCVIKDGDRSLELDLEVQIFTPKEIEYIKDSSIMHSVLKSI